MIQWNDNYSPPLIVQHPRTLSIGGATFDLFLRTDRSVVRSTETGDIFALPLGAKLQVRDAIGTFGGGAHNTAVGLARLGCDAGFVGVLGDDEWGDAIRRNMERCCVRTDYLTVIEGEASSFSLILMAEDGERTILTHKHMDRHLHDVTFDRHAASHAQCLYLNHIHADSCVIEDDLIQLLTKTPNAHLTWNPGGCQIEAGLREESNRALLHHVDLLLLNKEEASTFSGQAALSSALSTLCAATRGTVCITDGANGAIASDGSATWHCPGQACEVQDATGAGDAFGTGMTWGIITGKDLPTAMKAGTINAMSVVGHVGAQAGLLTRTQMDDALARTAIDVAPL